MNLWRLQAFRSVQSFCFWGFVGYVFWWLEGVMEGGMRQGREWNEIGERVERNRGGNGEESMNYPYIILTLFVPVGVDSG